MAMNGPRSCEEYADRHRDLQMVMKARFDELIGVGDLSCLDDEAVEAGWSIQEVREAITALIEVKKSHQRSEPKR